MLQLGHGPLRQEGLAQVDEHQLLRRLAVLGQDGRRPLAHAPGAEGILRHCQQLLPRQPGRQRLILQGGDRSIVVIANQGSTDLVMDAAREAGATGGTVIHAKGTGTDLVRKFFGVSIASEQEMVFILARSEAKKPIMKAIMAKAGIQSAAQSLVFSLPVGDIAGLRELEQPET